MKPAAGPDSRPRSAARRVLHLADRLTARGGAYRYLLDLAAAQAERHEVWIAAGRVEGAFATAARLRLVPGLDARTRQPVALDALAETVRPHAIHVHTVLNPAALEWAASRGAVMTVQDHRYFCPGRGRWTAGGHVCRDRPSRDTCGPCFDDDAYRDEVLGLTAERLAAVRRLRVTVLSSYMRDEMAAAGVPATRLHLIPPFVEPVPPAPRGREHVLFVGRLVAAKGPLDAVEAWRRCGTPLPLVAAGTGPLRAAMEAAGARVLGWVEHGALAAWYARAAAVVLPSRWQEPFGIVGLEALAHGVPVAAWDSGGVRDWHRGPLARWGDVASLAAHLERALRDPPGRVPIPAAFTRDAALAGMECVYRAAGEGLGSGAGGSAGSDGTMGDTTG